MHAKNAARVLPDPVGAAISTSSRAAIFGQPSRCGSVGAPNRSRNQPATSGWKASRTSTTALQTTPRPTGRTRRCSGRSRLVRSAFTVYAEAWLLQRIRSRKRAQELRPVVVEGDLLVGVAPGAQGASVADREP